MRKYLGHVIGFIIAAFILTPPWSYAVTCDINTPVWLWCVMLAGFGALAFVYTDSPLSIKAILIYAFINSFFSVAPYWSFMMLIPITISAYFYLACRKIEDFKIIQRAVQSAFFVICAFFITQALGHDTLYNFNRPQPMVIGTVGNRMISATLITCMAPFLLTYFKLNLVPLMLIAYITKSSGMWLALAVGVMVYVLLSIRSWAKRLCILSIVFVVLFTVGTPSRVIAAFPNGRGPIWKKAISLMKKHPFIGYGVATFQLAFPALSQDLKELGQGPEWTIENIKGKTLPAQQAHNDFIQWVFEFGIFGGLLLGCYMLGLAIRVIYVPLNDYSIRAISCAAILFTLMQVHFPTRLFGAVPVFICYLAYFERSLKGSAHRHGYHL